MGHEYDVKNGRWQTWGMELQLKLRAIHNSITLVGDVNGYYVPEANEWIGFDMKHGDWVLSGHKGNTSDFEVFLEWDGRPTQDSKLLKLHFRSIEPKGGFYYADLTNEHRAKMIKDETAMSAIKVHGRHTEQEDYESSTCVQELRHND